MKRRQYGLQEPPIRAVATSDQQRNSRPDHTPQSNCKNNFADLETAGSRNSSKSLDHRFVTLLNSPSLYAPAVSGAGEFLGTAFSFSLHHEGQRLAMPTKGIAPISRIGLCVKIVAHYGRRVEASFLSVVSMHIAGSNFPASVFARGGDRETCRNEAEIVP